MVFLSEKGHDLDYFLELGPNVPFDESYRKALSSSLNTHCQAHDREGALAHFQKDVLHPVIPAARGIAVIMETELLLFVGNLI